MRMCVLPRDDNLQMKEDMLSGRALVALVAGTRPRCSSERARRYILEQFDISSDGFTIHRFQPEDFLLFSDTAALEQVLNGTPSSSVGLILKFRRWQWFATAEADSMKFRVLVELRGIPSHAWSSAAAWVALGDHCACPEPTPAMVTRADL